MTFKINTRNDGKGKHQSWEAWIDINDNHGSNFNYMTNFMGYGATEVQAISNCNKAINSFLQILHDDKLINKI